MLLKWFILLLCIAADDYQDYLINHFKIFQIKRVKETTRYFGFDLDRLAHGRIIFAPVRKSLRNEEKTSAHLKKVLRNYALSWDLRFREKYFETKIFRDPILVGKQVAATFYYFADDGRMQKVASSIAFGKSTISTIITRVLFLL